jgi:hypothetical protein
MMSNPKAFLATCIVLAVGSANAQSTPFLRMAYEAIDSKSGSAQYKFDKTVPWVSLMRQKLELPGPITVRSTVLKRFAQEGCAQVQTMFQMHEATLNNGRLEDTTFALNFNICRDGSPPLESLDLATVEELTKLKDGESESMSKVLKIPVVPLSTEPGKPKK